MTRAEVSVFSVEPAGVKAHTRRPVHLPHFLWLQRLLAVALGVKVIKTKIPEKFDCSVLDNQASLGTLFRRIENLQS